MAFTDSGFGNPQGSSSTSIFSSFGGSSCAGGFRYDIRVESLSCVVKSRLAKIMCQLSIAFWRCSQLFNWIDIRHGYQTRHSGVHTLTKYHIFWNTVIKVNQRQH
ncbi:unnamed protein product [Schistosoma mattheei]|uniref:Uncharacterized protein n=1 Tax=Schistosoma mattheei TaxID=31246 RepID=A0AA85BCK9_9TREM|nr:unnamed protein product [Schistosoma mattheei]